MRGHEDITLNDVVNYVRNSAGQYTYGVELELLDCISNCILRISDNSADASLVELCELPQMKTIVSDKFIAALGAMFVLKDKKAPLLALAKLQREGLQYMPSAPFVVGVGLNRTAQLPNTLYAGIQNRMKSLDCLFSYNSMVLRCLGYTEDPKINYHFSYVGTCMPILPRITLMQTTLRNLPQDDMKVLVENDMRGVLEAVKILDDREGNDCEDAQAALMMVVIRALILLSWNRNANPLYQNLKTQFAPSQFMRYKQHMLLHQGALLLCEYDLSATMCLLWRVCINHEAFLDHSNKGDILCYNTGYMSIQLLALNGMLCTYFDNKSLIEVIAKRTTELQLQSAARYLDYAFQYQDMRWDEGVYGTIVDIITAYPNKHDVFLEICVQWLPVHGFVYIMLMLCKQMTPIDEKSIWAQHFICRVAGQTSSTKDIKAAIMFCNVYSFQHIALSILVNLTPSKKECIAKEAKQWGLTPTFQKLLHDCGVYSKQVDIVGNIISGTPIDCKGLPFYPDMPTAWCMLYYAPLQLQGLKVLEQHINTNEILPHKLESLCSSFIEDNPRVDTLLRACHNLGSLGTMGRKQEKALERQTNSY